MSVFKMKDKPHGKLRKLPWCCERLSATGQKRRMYFKTRPEADAYDAREKERRRTSRTGMYSIQDLKRHTVKEIVLSYATSSSLRRDELHVSEEEEKELRKELAERTHLPDNAFTVLWSFARRSISELNLYEFNKEVAEKYIEGRLGEPKKVHENSKSNPQTVASSTVGWEVMKIRKAWDWARKNYPDLVHLDNPWHGIAPTSVGAKRDRELVGNELEVLLAACDGCLGRNKYYLALGIVLAAETGMRRQEFMGLSWEDIDFERRRITIRKSKTDKATGSIGKAVEIAMPIIVGAELRRLRRGLVKGRLPGPQKAPTTKAQEISKGRIFVYDNGEPMTGDAFSDAFDAVAIRANIKDLTVKDLRQTANTMFIRAGLEPEERQIMLRETNKSMNARHYQGAKSRELFLERIQSKLDRHVLGGKTVEEVTEEWKKLELKYLTLREAALQAGAAPEIALEAAMKVMLEKHPDLAALKAKVAEINAEYC